MRYQTSVFHQLTKHIPWDVFDQSVERHGADHRVRRLRCRDQFMALLYGQLAGAVSLREIEIGMQSWQSRLYQPRARTISRSTLADANAKRPAQIYADVYQALVKQARPGVRRKMKDAVRLIDSSKLRLTGRSESWVKPMRNHHFAKIHVVYDPHAVLPLETVVTANTVSDLTPAKMMDIEPGVTYVFDLAYYKYDWWHKLDAAGCRFVTRMKTFTKLTKITERPLCKGDSSILADRSGVLARQFQRGPNAWCGPLREVMIERDGDKPLRLVTNDFEATAQEISDLYKLRWEIELFFKWIKQNLKLKHFIGTSENAVKIQIYIALIAFLILKAAHGAQKSIPKLQAFTRLARLCIMSRHNLRDLLQPFKLRPDNPDQFNLELAKC